jgi:hypothetical protein
MCRSCSIEKRGHECFLLFMSEGSRDMVSSLRHKQQQRFVQKQISPSTHPVRKSGQNMFLLNTELFCHSQNLDF